MYLSVVIEALQDVPSPVPVFGVLGKSIHIEQTLHCFWSQQVVSVCRLEDKGLYQYSNDLKRDHKGFAASVRTSHRDSITCESRYCYIHEQRIQSIL